MYSEPQYVKLYRLLRSQIERGRFKPGQLFYSQNELMHRFHLSYSTVARALDQLEHDGLITRKQGKGTFVHDHFEKQRGSVSLFEPCTVEVYYQPTRFEFDYIPPEVIFRDLQRTSPPGVDWKLIPYPVDTATLYESVFRAEVSFYIFYDPPSHLAEFVADASAAHPVLVVGQEPMKIEAVPLVSLDFAAAGKMAAAALRPTTGAVYGALLPEKLDTPCMQQLVGGLRDILIQHGGILKSELIRHASARNGGGYRAMLDLFCDCQEGLPNGIVLVGTELTYGALTALSTALNTAHIADTLKIVAIAWPEARYPWPRTLPTVFWPSERFTQHILSFVHYLRGNFATSPVRATPTQCPLKASETMASPEA